MKRNPVRFAARAAGATLAAAGGWGLYSKLFINHRRPLPEAMEARRTTVVSSRAGELSYYADERGEGLPLVLLHSVNAAASSYEMRPIFERFRGMRPVYALDLPGFGFSERSNRVYSPELYAGAINDFLDHAISGHEVDVVALSLASEFAARAALDLPDRIRSLTLISPTGFGGREPSGGNDRVYRGFAFPVWSQAFYDLLTSPASIRHYLRKSFAGPVDPGLAAYDYETSHQPGARHAPLYFISGKLFTPQAAERLYAGLAMPVLVLYDRDGYVTFDRLPDFLARHRNWRGVRIPGTMGLPHFEKPVEAFAALQDFWSHAHQALQS